MTRPEAALIDELEFRSYVHNRKIFPAVSLDRWALIFSNVPEMEERYLDMLSTGNILDVAPQGGTGVSTAAALDCGVSRDGHGHTLGESGAPRNPLSSNAEPRKRDTSVLADSGLLDVADRATGNAPVTDGLQVGDEGVSGTVDGHGAEGVESAGTGEGCQSVTSMPGGSTIVIRDAHLEARPSSEYQASPADSQYQGLLIERLIGSVERAEEHAELLEQLRLEEEAAAEEGAAIENSGYRDPAENVRFA